MINVEITYWIDYFATEKLNTVISWKNYFENPDELQIKNNESADWPGRMRNRDVPYVRGPLGQYILYIICL